MTIQNLAYSAQQYLQSITSDSFKRSHIHELLAASFGFNTYAAFNASAVFTLRRSETKLLGFSGSVIRRRCIELGYNSRTSDRVASEFSVFFAERKISAMNIHDLVRVLRSGEYFDEFEDDVNAGESYDDEGDEPDQTDAGLPNWDDSYEDVQADLILPITVEGLKKGVSKKVALAHYALALIYDPKRDGQEQEIGSHYWYDQEQKGQVLTGVNKVWADAYAAHLVRVDDHIWHLREAARLGQQDAQLDMAARFNDPAFFEQETTSVLTHPRDVAEVAERLGRDDDARKWLAMSAEDGDIDAMRRLIEGYDSGDLQQCWTWMYLATLFGSDLTQDNYRAMHEDGSDYDDDVGGSIATDGDAGVHLQPLSAELDARARCTAQDIFGRSH